MELDDLTREVFEWETFEYDHAVLNKHHALASPVSHFSSNYIRRIILNSDVIFGLPILIIFVVIFSEYVAGEIEEKNIYLFRSQPTDKKKTILSKFFIGILWGGYLFYFYSLIYVLKRLLIWCRYIWTWRSI